MGLVELMIASLLTLLVLGMGFEIFTTTSRTSTTIGNRATNSTSARVAINLLETNLRYATGVLLCGAPAGGVNPSGSSPTASGMTANVCRTPTANNPAVLVVTNNSVTGLGPTQPACTEWTFIPAGSGVGLARTVSSAKAFTTVAPTALPWPYPTASAAHPVASPGFSEPLPRLVEVDFTVNVEVAPVAANAVTVRDLISPNAPVASTTTLTGACP
jgi:hypothetical protein